MSAFNSSAIAASNLSACEIERSHIFVEGSTLAGLDRAGNNTSEREEKLQFSCEHTFRFFPLFFIVNREPFLTTHIGSKVWG